MLVHTFQRDKQLPANRIADKKPQNARIHRAFYMRFDSLKNSQTLSEQLI